MCPKGVAITHRNVTQLLASLDAGVGGAQVWAQWHSLAFDVSVWDIFGALLHGGSVGGGARGGDALAAGFPRVVGRRAGRCAQSDSRRRAGALSPPGIGVGWRWWWPVRRCPTELVERWAPGRVMINAYGPTETTVYAAISAPLTAGRVGGADRRPVPGVALFVLDAVVAAGAGRGGR